MHKGKNMDTERKFDGRAKDYIESRPSYSPELLEYLNDNYKLFEAGAVADIGSGTGKFAKLLLRGNCEVYGVEPNDDMRRTAEKELSGCKNFHSVAGKAEDTALKSGSVDNITTAQAFHWFDVSRFKSECLRILKDGGKVFLIWNIRDNDDTFNKEWQAIFARYCSDFKGFSNGISKDDEKIISFFDGVYGRVSFSYPLIFDRAGFIKRSLSSSYSIKEGEKDYEQYIAVLNALFDKYENDGKISVANSSVAYIGNIK